MSVATIHRRDIALAYGHGVMAWLGSKIEVIGSSVRRTGR